MQTGGWGRGRVTDGGMYKDVVVASSRKDRKHSDSHPHLHHITISSLPFFLIDFLSSISLQSCTPNPTTPKQTNTPSTKMSSYLEQNLSFYTVRHPLPTFPIFNPH